MMTLLAATRLIPSEPARVEMRNRRPLEERDGATGRSERKLQNRQRFYHPLRVLPDVAGVVKLFGPLFPGGGVGGAVQAVVVDVPEPLAFTFKDTLHQIKSDGFIFFPPQSFVCRKPSEHTRHHHHDRPHYHQRRRPSLFSLGNRPPASAHRPL